MDKTSLNLIPIVLGGVGLFVVLTKFSVPELHATFLGSNPFAIKRDIIESAMTWLFTGLTLLGLLVQVGVAIWSNHIEERVHTTRFYVVLFVVVLAVGVALVPLLTAVGNLLARRSWLPEIVENQKEVYKAASFVIEHDGWREDQLAVRGTLPDPERYRTANLETAARQVEQLEKLLESSFALDGILGPGWMGSSRSLNVDNQRCRRTAQWRDRWLAFARCGRSTRAFGEPRREALSSGGTGADGI